MRTSLTILATAALVLSGVAAAQAQPVKPAKKFTITSSVSKTRLDLGDKITVTGTVSPASAGKVTVLVQYADFQPGEYQKVGTDQLNSKSKYTKTFTPTHSGPSKVMVVKAASGSRLGATTKKSFSNFGDVPLEALSAFPVDGSFGFSDLVRFSAEDATTSGLVVFPGAAGFSTVRFSLQQQCTRFYGGSGLDLSSPAGSHGTGRISTTRANATFTSLSAVSATRGDPGHTQNLALEKKVKGSLKRASNLVISTYVDSPSAVWAVAQGEAHCNLPGATL